MCQLLIKPDYFLSSALQGHYCSSCRSPAQVPRARRAKSPGPVFTKQGIWDLDQLQIKTDRKHTEHAWFSVFSLVFCRSDEFPLQCSPGCGGRCRACNFHAVISFPLLFLGIFHAVRAAPGLDTAQGPAPVHRPCGCRCRPRGKQSRCSPFGLCSQVIPVPAGQASPWGNLGVTLG